MGQIYRGKLIEAVDNMNSQMASVTYLLFWVPIRAASIIGNTEFLSVTNFFSPKRG